MQQTKKNIWSSAVDQITNIKSKPLSSSFSVISLMKTETLQLTFNHKHPLWCKPHWGLMQEEDPNLSPRHETGEGESLTAGSSARFLIKKNISLNVTDTLSANKTLVVHGKIQTNGKCTRRKEVTKKKTPTSNPQTLSVCWGVCLCWGVCCAHGTHPLTWKWKSYSYVSLTYRL